MAYIDLGLVDGNFFNAASVDTIEAAINNIAWSASIVMTVRAVAPTGWLFLNGAVVVNFQGLYPDAWAVIPASWKSGSNANLPNMAARFPIGQDGSHVLGATGGANTHTIASGNLPVHTHAIDHDHPLLTVSGFTSDAVDHTYGTGGVHAHVISNPLNGATNLVVTGAGGGVVAANIPITGASYGTLSTAYGTGATGNQHQHDFSINIDLPNFVAASGNGGFANTAIDHTPQWLAVNFMLKVH